jgi:hypothetical protein
MFLKKLPGFFDKDMLQLFEFELFLFDHGIPGGGQALWPIRFSANKTASSKKLFMHFFHSIFGSLS